MEKKLIMALDQGTTSSRCILFKKNGEIASIAQREFTQIYPKPGYVEHDPLEIWSSQLSVATEAMAKINAKAEDIVSIGITNQRETTIVWDKETGEPIYNAIVWQCHRTADMIEKMVEDGLGEYVRNTTGLIPDAYFSASKLAWILNHIKGAREKAKEGKLIFGTVDTWLIWKLTKGRIHTTDYTNASRTMLFDIKNLDWDQKILDYFDIPRCMLPEVHPSSYKFGETDSQFFGGPVIIGGVAGDQQASLFGQCCFNEGDVKNTYGTGCFLLMNTGKNILQSKKGLLTTIAAGDSDDVDYALEGSVFVGGAAIQWLRDGMRMIKNAAQSEEYACAVSSSEGVYVVPSFTGMGAPYWNQHAKGIVVGLTRGCSKEHFIRATLESVAYQSYDVLNAMELDLGKDITSLKVDGGASNNDFLMQFQSDVMDADVIRSKCSETTALGAAYLAGLAAGFYESKEELISNWELSNRFQPSVKKEVREKLIKGWKKAVKTALVWAEEE
ncbi:MAG: glycerol kinase GlpK [Lachnospiraceae bacterium]|nr:glycerol kinase GlpK [Lachnospiraceae bacterium]